MNRLKWFYKNDKRALLDFIGCIDHCNGCRASDMCDEFREYANKQLDSGKKCEEAEFLMQDMPGHEGDDEDETMKVSLSEFLGMESWENEKLCEYVDKQFARAESLGDLIRDMLYCMSIGDGNGCMMCPKAPSCEGVAEFEARADELGVSIH